MPEVVTDNLRDGYRRLVARVKSEGARTDSQSGPVREILGMSIVLTNPLDALPIGVGRGLNRAIAAAEALQLIAGESHPSLMLRIAPQFKQYMDGGTFHGAYGPRLRGQFYQLINKLRSYPNTRQALVTLWDPAADNVRCLHDYPCTTALQFFLRDGSLDMQVYMRSNDVWRGLAYDAFQFTQLQMTIAKELGAPIGTYRHYAASLHLYESDVTAAIKMLNCDQESHDVLTNPYGISVVDARLLLSGARASLTSSDAAWYVDAVGKYL